MNNQTQRESLPAEKKKTEEKNVTFSEKYGFFMLGIVEEI